MKRFIYKCRKYNSLIKILGIILGIIGAILVLKIIPVKIWLFILGLTLIGVGWTFFRLY
ncbi:hypothetical protein [Gottschalkia acidurici]|uniref:hypothetical protein n=1 Tax=Clostridium acidurici TaxID=1556 RepID=UPI00031DF286|nr:hypothetical protein [Gottschalkia acidurici]